MVFLDKYTKNYLNSIEKIEFQNSIQDLVFATIYWL